MSHPEQLTIFDLVPNLPHSLAESQQLMALFFHPHFRAMLAIEANPKWPVFAVPGMPEDRRQLVTTWEQLEEQLRQQGFTPLEIYAAHLIDKE